MTIEDIECMCATALARGMLSAGKSRVSVHRTLIGAGFDRSVRIFSVRVALERLKRKGFPAATADIPAAAGREAAR